MAVAIAAGCGSTVRRDAPIGSLIVIDLPDRAAVYAALADEPYNAAHLFESITVRRFGPVIEPSLGPSS